MAHKYLRYSRAIPNDSKYILKPVFFCQFDGVVMLVCCLDDYIMYISRSDDFRTDNDDDRHMNRSLYLLCMASGVTISTI
jgi:hypothetical protein